ncbi:MAG: GGDEF domain-containing protein [Sulfurospirillaceae bacterium]|nr:GGDEF domain-containing protein [Sulfurospirillaceae bacterium]MCK9545364.1 GGDEF domain-containing protein [Sulfurospirillaceae bacterium]MDY0238700.1 GGDEF domain-containing protein [Campylobacterales bacterium]NLM98829.1 GGDEF domain-containing protein [Campylobacteraceae bacterium]
MSTMNEIIKESLETIKEKHLTLTPDTYNSIFCQVAKSKGVIVEDCQKIEKLISRLDQSFQSDITRLKIQTVEELVSFLIATLNRLNPVESAKLIKSLVFMNKRVLQAVSLLHNKKAKELANSSLQRLDVTQSYQNVELIKDKWFNFINEYSSDFLKKLDSYGKVNKEDLKALVDDVLKILDKEPDDSGVYKKIAPLLVATLVPSIASSMNDELATISYELKNSPEVLATTAMQKDIEKFIKKRVELDKKEVEEKIGALDRLLDNINQKVLALMKTSQISSEDAKIIKDDLNSINFNKDSFESIQMRLITIASSLENEALNFHKKMLEHQHEMGKMQLKVKKLEEALLVAKKESNEDFLTTVASKRALDDELNRAEEAFMRYGINYSLCFIDLDKFKNINDTFGHEAGDVILKNVGKILKKFSRNVDFVGRYGGEEFLVVLPNLSLNQAVSFANKICKTIERYKFLYKKDEIKVTVSCGVSERKNNSSKDSTIEDADKMLYQAKISGRNAVMPSVG